MTRSTRFSHLYQIGLGAVALAAAVAAHAAPAVIEFPVGPVDNIGPQTYDQTTVYSAALLEQQRVLGLLTGKSSTTDFTPAMGRVRIFV